MEKLLWILNRHAGRGEIASRAVDCIDVFQQAGYDVSVHLTEGDEDTVRIAQQSGETYERIVCAGGDGTLNAVITGLMQAKKRPVVGYIPAGTTNDFASSLGVPKDSIKAAQIAVGHSLRTLDVGQFNERYFNYIAAFGLFTAASYATPQQSKNIFGRAAYIMEGIKSLGNIKTCHLTYQKDGQECEGDFVFGMVSNTTSVGGFKTIRSDHVRMDDGLYEVMLVHLPPGPIELQALANDLLQNKQDSQWYDYFCTSDISFSSVEPIAWTLDGEFGGAVTQANIHNFSRAITFAAAQEEENA